MTTMDDKFYTITELTKIIKGSLEENPNLINTWIKGEISNLTYHSSGHIYFTLKDENAIISLVFFKYLNKNLSFRLEEGMNLLAFGGINVFEKRGSYQFIVSEVRLEGIGELQQRIEQLKKKLMAEGIFDTKHKKDIPVLPRRIGIVTSPTGAAIRDILKVAMRRFPNIEFILAPAKVQGEDAAFSIARGIEELNNPQWDIDIIIAGRGGGSFEDLMPFNEEIVIRAFYNSRVPIISAVGHQIDHPLCDDAADYAAPTPSAAAEISTPVKRELLDYIDNLSLRSQNALTSRIMELKTRIEGILNLRIFRNPKEIIYNHELLLTDIENHLISLMKDCIVEKRNNILMLPDLNILIKHIIKDKIHRYSIGIQGLEKLSPIGILKRGYSISTDIKENIIKSISKLKIGDIMNVHFHDGSTNCTVNQIDKGVKIGKERKDIQQTDL
ncbi:MAG: exodeoxyribonuclease VII large subunit [Spirochaetota bacterium]|nr:exodeoxyribonuclease VII large subunit [Spirochaetota bacterium]